MKISNRTNASNRGQTIVQVVVAVAVVCMAVVLAIGAADPAADRQAKIAQCANNLRLLAAADHCYADDFGGKFFYDWGRPKTLDGKDAGEPKRWWDKERVGRYVQGVALQWYRSQEATERFVNDAGLGDGVFHCPADTGGLIRGNGDSVDSNDIVGVRSYHQNFWASGIDDTGLPEVKERTRDIDPPGAVRLRPSLERRGRFFDRNSEAQLDKLILVSEVLSVWRVRRAGSRMLEWATGGEFGADFTPRERFAGTSKVERTVQSTRTHDRWARTSFHVQLAYTRHGGDLAAKPTEGGVNIAYADGHVAWRTDRDLVAPYWEPWTYDTMWSPVDREVDEKGVD